MGFVPQAKFKKRVGNSGDVRGRPRQGPSRCGTPTGTGLSSVLVVRGQRPRKAGLSPPHSPCTKSQSRGHTDSHRPSLRLLARSATEQLGQHGAVPDLSPAAGLVRGGAHWWSWQAVGARHCTRLTRARGPSADGRAGHRLPGESARPAQRYLRNAKPEGAALPERTPDPLRPRLVPLQAAFLLTR